MNAIFCYRWNRIYRISYTCLLLLEKGYAVFILDSFVNSSEKSIKKLILILKNKGIETEENSFN